MVHYSIFGSCIRFFKKTELVLTKGLRPNVAKHPNSVATKTLGWSLEHGRASALHQTERRCVRAIEPKLGFGIQNLVGEQGHLRSAGTGEKRRRFQASDQKGEVGVIETRRDQNNRSGQTPHNVGVASRNKEMCASP